MVRASYVVAALLIPGVVGAQTTTTTIQGPDGRPATVTTTQAPPGGVNRIDIRTGTSGAPVGGPIGGPVRDPRAAPATGTSVIRGRVFDAANNAPLRKAVVMIFGAEIRESRSTTTDPEGRYEFTDLPAGQYNVSANKPGYVNANFGQIAPNESGKQLRLTDKQTAEKVDFSLPRGAVITGRVLDEYGEPVPDVMVSAQKMQYTASGARPMNFGRPGTTNDIGEFRLYGLPPGQFLLSATYRQMVPGNVTNADNTGYAPTYYPGTANVSDAMKLPVGSGGSISDVTLVLVPTRTARVSGVVFDAQGRPVKSGNVMLMNRTPSMMMTNGGGPIRPDGTFSISGIAPGEYTVRAMVQGQPGVMMTEAATATVTVNGIDVTDLRVEPVRQVTVSGRVVMDAAAARSFQPSAMRLSATPSEPMPTFGPPSPPVSVRDDFTFEFKVNPGTLVVRANATTPGSWMVKAITLNGADVTDGLTFKDEDVIGLEIELTNRVPEVSGLVTDGKGDSVSDYFAVVFPQEQERWTAPGVGRTAMVRPDDQGRFKFRTLRPGTYYVVAVDHVETGEWMDPAFMESVHRRATRIAVNEGDTQTLDLKLLRRNEPR